MNTLTAWQRRDVPPWCYITAAGVLESPKHSSIRLPDDAFRALDIFWDGQWCRADYFTWHYGEVYRYRGPQLPAKGSLWRQDRYRPAPELEVRIVNLAGLGTSFEVIERRIRRPRMEIAAIMAWHGYNGWACAIHNGETARYVGS